MHSRQMPFQRLKFLSVLKADNVVGGHRLLHWDSRLGRWGIVAGRCFRRPSQSNVDVTDQFRKIIPRKAMMTYIGCNDFSRKPRKVIMDGFFHWNTPSG